MYLCKEDSYGIVYFQFIVGADGYNGLNYEHTTAEGPPIISLADHCVNFM